MQDFKNLASQIPKKYYFILAVMLVIIIVASVAGIIIKTQSEKEHRIDFSDTSVLSDVPDETIEHFKQNLLTVLQRDFQVKSDTIFDDINIRTDSYQESTKDSVITATFLIDIPSIEQTYKVTLYWSPDKSVEFSDVDALIECPASGENAYPNSTCYGGTYGYATGAIYG